MRVFRAILLVELAACGFNPQPRGGALPCDDGCPSGYYCAKDGTCWQNGFGPDASTAGGSQSGDAPVASVPPVDAGLSGADVGATGAAPDAPVATGGAVGSGGVTTSGGQIGSGGVAGSGGLAGTGGVASSGGLSDTGAASGKGGVVGAGGIVGTGGTTGAGGGSAVGTLSVLAGVPSGVGSADGTGTAARFAGPYGVAVDGAGNIFVADTGNCTIRRITPAGAVRTFAGKAGAGGSADGTGAAARFWSPGGVAVDGAGNIFVADTGNCTIRKITPEGVVTTLAGSAGACGSADGTGAAARFVRPSGIAVDGAGSIFVADSYINNTYSHTIRKITSEGVVTTFAGSAGMRGSEDGTGPTARFNNPTGVAVDRAGNVFVADTDNRTIRKITPGGVVTTFAGTPHSDGGSDGTGAAAQFHSPGGVAIDRAGNIFVADTGVNTIRKITPAAVVTTLAGGRDDSGSTGSRDGTGAAARFAVISVLGVSSGVAADETGNVFVADTDNNAIRKITPAGVVTTLAGAADSKGSADGAGANTRFNRPSGVAVDGAGNLFVADTWNNTIRGITPAGVVTTFAGSAGKSGSADGTGATARFSYPGGVAVDGAGNVFVADTGRSIIRKVTPAGVVTTFAGSANSWGSADGTGAAARFSCPDGMAVDGAGNVFVTDGCDSTIRRITPTGVVTTFAGTAGSRGNTDGIGAAARFAWPEGVAVDGTGNVFVADSVYTVSYSPVTTNNTIRKITPEGVVTTLAGTAGSQGSADGTGPAARFNLPRGVAADRAGNVFVADTGNGIIRKITASGAVTTVVGVVGENRGNLPGPLPASIVSPFGVAVDSSGSKLYITLPDAVMVAVLPN